MGSGILIVIGVLAAAYFYLRLLMKPAWKWLELNAANRVNNESLKILVRYLLMFFLVSIHFFVIFYIFELRPI
tara:strand:- start:3805 stop:4023 length:219 start_codon:yes stop_codon:yes gene_type:complete